MLAASNKEHLPEALLVAVLGEDAPVHGCHLPPGASRTIAHEPGRGDEELGARDPVLVVFLEAVAALQQVAERPREEAVAVFLNRLLVRGHGGDHLHDRSLAKALERKVLIDTARVKEDAAGGAKVEVQEDVLDADALDLLFDLGELDSGPVCPARRNRK